MADKALLTTVDYLEMLVQFAKDAPTLDFKGDRVLQWISIVTFHAEAAIACERAQ